MLISHPYPFRWRGHPATLYLLRNDGYCWGRLVDVCGEQYDVSPDGDIYDDCDTDALEALAELAIEQPHRVADAVSSLRLAFVPPEDEQS